MLIRLLDHRITVCAHIRQYVADHVIGIIQMNYSIAQKYFSSRGSSTTKNKFAENQRCNVQE